MINMLIGLVIFVVLVAVMVPAAWFGITRFDGLPKRETYAEMMLRSARLDHELWPNERDWNHPRGCAGCRPPPTTSELGTTVHMVTTGHDADWGTRMVECRQLGTPEPYLIPGAKYCRECDRIEAERTERMTCL